MADGRLGEAPTPPVAFNAAQMLRYGAGRPRAMPLWFRTYNDSFVVASSHRQMAFYSGFTGGASGTHFGKPGPR